MPSITPNTARTSNFLNRGFKVDEKGDGEGTLIAIAEVQFSEEGRVEVTTQGTQPFRLLKIKPMKVKK